MHLSSLCIESFRNIEKQHFQFNPEKNYFFGDNAQGKTNLLEAIYLLCLCKSFRSAADQEMIQMGKMEYKLSGRFMDAQNIDHEVIFQYGNKEGKHISLDGKPIYQYSSLVGQFPVVVLSVADYDITHGPPQQRRRFINILSSQCSPRYLSDLKEYERIVKQRNKVLGSIQSGKRYAESELEVWDEQLLQKGAAVIMFRHQLVAELNQLIQNYYRIIAWGSPDIFSVTYQPRIDALHPGDVVDQFKVALRKSHKLEKMRGMTLVGPHRDDFVFNIGERPLRNYGSRGEHKSALISLKAAEATLLRQRLQVSPLLLLDDLYAELDRIRGEKVMDIFSDGSQCFITATSFDYDALVATQAISDQKTQFFVKQGIFTLKNNGS